MKKCQCSGVAECEPFYLNPTWTPQKYVKKTKTLKQGYDLRIFGVEVGPTESLCVATQAP